MVFITLNTSQQENDDYENIYGVNLSYLIINKTDGYIEESNGNKYLIFN